MLLLSLRSLGAPTEANRDQLRQAQTNYARIQGGPRWRGMTAMGSVYYIYIYIFIYIGIRVEFVPLLRDIFIEST